MILHQEMNDIAAATRLAGFACYLAVEWSVDPGLVLGARGWWKHIHPIGIETLTRRRTIVTSQT